MKDKNDETVETYQKNFVTYVERTRKELADDFKDGVDIFLGKLPSGGNIFEIGSASGRDAHYIKRMGFNVLCTDVIPQALERLTKEGFETSYYDFRETPSEDWKGQFDGVFANAVLLHAPDDVFHQALLHILSILKDKGYCSFSVQAGTGDEISMGKMDAPRFFKYYSPEELERILARYPLEIVNISTIGNDKWIQVIFRKL